MHVRMRKLAISTTSALLLPLPLADAFNATTIKHKTHKLVNPELSSEIVAHGFLLWVSMGVLMPLGIITIRVCSSGRRENCGRRLKMLFYAHVALQMLAVGLVTAGAVMSIKNFENAFNNNHQKIGLGLYGMTWLQPLIGYCRPQRGSKRKKSMVFCALDSWNSNLTVGNHKHLHWLACIPHKDWKKCEHLDHGLHCSSLLNCSPLPISRQMGLHNEETRSNLGE
ncbi:hypothetical protein Scep_027319 [Stephania cephalantha]|uniref:Cytochrome b561 domain-containing protein n=1 Tax=Stephania cephalantha TaxID=152367 RepID=A0AAP0EB58_9MAGN